jgi:hypothetical protein
VLSRWCHGSALPFVSVGEGIDAGGLGVLRRGVLTAEENGCYRGYPGAGSRLDMGS